MKKVDRIAPLVIISAFIALNLVSCRPQGAPAGDANQDQAVLGCEGSGGRDAIAFLSDRDDDIEAELYVMNADGTNPVDISNQVGNIYLIIPSPGGCRIAFESFRLFSTFNLYVVNTDGSDLVRIAPDVALPGIPYWSPDGTRIAFADVSTTQTAEGDDVVNGNGEVYVVNADGSNLVRITTNVPDVRKLRWSPDGNRIAFVGHGTRQGERGIHMVNADGSDLVKIAADMVVHDDFAWSPDGSRIAFAASNGDTSNLYVVNVDGSNLVSIIPDVGGDDLAWSPEGSRLAFKSYSRNGLFVVNADGSNLVRIDTEFGPPYRGPIWSPDGSRIAFVELELKVVNADGSDLVSIARASPSLTGGPAWSADGTRIAFEGRTGDSAMEIYVVSADGSNLVNITNNPAEDTEPVWVTRQP